MAESFSVKRRSQRLQDICLRAIAKNFEDIPKPDWGVEYLQSLWSQELLNRFQEEWHAGNFIGFKKRVLFIVNPYLKVLDLNMFSREAHCFIINKLKTIKSTLNVFISKDRTYLHLLPSTITSLSLSDLTDSKLKVIAKKFPLLQNLNVHDSIFISDSGVKALCRKDVAGNVIPNLALQSLNVEGTEVSIRGFIFVLKHFPNLLEFHHHRFGELIYRAYKFLSSSSDEPLTSIACHLKSVKLNHGFCEYIAPFDVLQMLFPHLTELSIRMVLAQEVFDVCAKFVLLEKIVMSLYEPCNMLPFLETRGKNLTALSITAPFDSRFFISLETICKLCPGLESLYFGEVIFKELTPFAYHDFKYNLPHLRDLIIISAVDHQNDSLFEKSFLYIISRSPNLERLTFQGKFQSSSFVDSFIQCDCMASLKELHMDSMAIDKAKLIAAMPSFYGIGFP